VLLGNVIGNSAWWWLVCVRACVCVCVCVCVCQSLVTTAQQG
jgi:hypothetical protein